MLTLLAVAFGILAFSFVLVLVMGVALEICTRYIWRM